jgi:carboxymethylenebutenolidase
MVGIAAGPAGTSIGSADPDGAENYFDPAAEWWPSGGEAPRQLAVCRACPRRCSVAAPAGRSGRRAGLMLDRTTIARVRVAPPRLPATLAGCVLALLALLAFAAPALAQTSQPLTVGFPSADGVTRLVGYLFAPAGRPKLAPAVVLLSGPGGIYSPRAKGNYSAVTLDKTIRGWAELWAGQGYWALVVDSYGPRGLPGGVAGDAGRDAASRPLDAYGALHYLRASPRVRDDRIGLVGWGGGASAVLVAMDRAYLPVVDVPAAHGFHAALAVDAGCRPPDAAAGYAPYAPLGISTRPQRGEAAVSLCRKLAAAGKAVGGDIAASNLEAPHDPDRRRSTASDPAADTQERRLAVTQFAALLGR